ncbi:hypothetical protein F0P96_10155 [Hymenobacter busanensis]|uniref:Uncharacterized protein n=1 Tax=Hymenobacter busanensis TaxID=2607656 RepID=A0A7L4ZY88_9BACT|nr:hypothetical protein [Hymenobacter busanensis]KAA9333324.1 hypothetical protein F0P96_10155 [Hymenobacter busanensis]QHJ07997.1 hypothetical protein GUY19_12155 [Hymenobacter busanensis]
MEPLDEKRAAALVDTWLANHPNRIADHRSDPVLLENWKRSAVRRLLEGIPHDSAQILERFATKVEGPVMH